MTSEVIGTLRDSVLQSLTELHSHLTKQRIALYGLVFSALSIIISILPLSTILAIIAFCLCIYQVALMGYERFRANGLLHYLPSRMKRTFTSRSIFDLLCDLWFRPQKTKNVMSVAIAPFWSYLPPEEAIHHLDGLDNKTRTAILTKGIINIVPASIKNILLPVGMDESNVNGIPHGQSERFIITPAKKDVQHDEVSTNKPASEDFISEDDGVHKARALAIVRSPSTDASNKEIPEIKDMVISGPGAVKMKRFRDEDALQPRTEVILSSSMFYNQKKARKAEIVERWDKLDSFKSSKAAESIVHHTIRRGNSIPTINPPTNPLTTIQELINLQKHFTNLHGKMELKTLMKVIGSSSAFLVMQLLLSKRVRGWFRSTFIFAVYFVCIVVASGASGILVLKYLKKRREDEANRLKNEEHNKSL